MNTDTLTATDGMRLTVSQVKRLAKRHGLTTGETMDLLNSLSQGGDNLFDAQDTLRQLGY